MSEGHRRVEAPTSGDSSESAGNDSSEASSGLTSRPSEQLLSPTSPAYTVRLSVLAYHPYTALAVPACRVHGDCCLELHLILRSGWSHEEPIGGTPIRSVMPGSHDADTTGRSIPLLRPPQRMPRLRYHRASRANRRRRRKMSARRSLYGICVRKASLWHERHSVGLRVFVKCLAMSLCDGISDAWGSCTLQHSRCGCSKQSWQTRCESTVLDCCYTHVLTHIADILRAYLGPKSEGEVKTVDDKVRQRLVSNAPVDLSSTLRHLPEPRVGHLPQCPGPDGDPSSTATLQWPTTPHPPPPQHQQITKTTRPASTPSFAHPSAALLGCAYGPSQACVQPSHP